MTRLLPGKTLLAVFAVAALLCAVFVSQFNKIDLGLSAMAIPVFIVSALLGMRRNAELASLRESMEDPALAKPKQAD